MEVTQNLVTRKLQKLEVLVLLLSSSPSIIVNSFLKSKTAQTYVLQELIDCLETRDSCKHLTEI